MAIIVDLHRSSRIQWSRVILVVITECGRSGSGIVAEIVANYLEPIGMDGTRRHEPHRRRPENTG